MGNLSEIQELKRKKILLEIEKEINTLENQIKHKKITKLNNMLAKKSKLSLVYLRQNLPILVSFGLTAYVFSLFNITPFVLDDQIRYKEVKTTMDNNGNIRHEEQYSNYDNKQNKIRICDKWEKIDENNYKRNVRVYKVSNKINSLDDIENLLTSNYSEITEIKNNLSLEEINSNGLIEGEFYSKDKNEYIIAKEYIDDNIGFTLLWFMISFFLTPAFYDIDKTVFKNNYEENIEKIKEQYKNINFDELEKKLEIKKSNYNRLK